MNQKFKLTYFNLSGRGEPIRLLLAYGGFKFEDNRIEMEDWPKVKPTTPLGQVPVLEMDGTPYTQSGSICKYLGAIQSIDGKSALENLVVDAVFEILWDLLKTAYEHHFEADAERKAKLLEKLQKQLPVILGKLEKDTKNNGGYIALKRITWADVVFIGAYEDIKNLVGLDSFEKYPNLEQLKTKILQIKNLRDYIQNRPACRSNAKYDLKNDL